MKNKNFTYPLIVLLIVLFSLGPIFWCFIVSVTPESDMLQATVGILPDVTTFEHYEKIFDAASPEHATVMNGLVNSLKISAITLAIGVPISYLTAYALARFDFKFKKIYIRLLLLTVVIPVFTTIIPVYNIYRKFGILDNTFWNCVIYVSSFLPLNTWVTMNYIKEIPEELWQASKIDGFSEGQILTKIALPVSAPVILTTTLIMLLMSWKQYIIPMILLSSYDNKPLTMIMSEFMSRYAINYGIIAAVGIISIIPPALGALFFRKFLISGLTSGSVKG